MNDPMRNAVHYTELAPAEPGPLAEEWETYRREVRRLLAEGKEGKYALIEAGAIVGVFDSRTAAGTEGTRRFLLRPFLVQEIRTWEPLLKTGYNKCRI